MSFFSGKVVIVTGWNASFFANHVIILGSSNGIGRGTAVLFAKNGAKVTITGRNFETLKVFCSKKV